MMWAFVDWAMQQFSGQRFGICGKTVDSASKNIVVPFISMSLAKERYTMRWRRADKVLEVRRGAVTNYFEVFGGKDESSFALIQGRTLAGVLLDEVALMPRSFVEQALTRCSVDGAKLWFSCNPESPQHWFYTEWIRRHRERNALYLHFALTDNPSLSEERIKFYETSFTGVFYERYVLGKWVLAEGLVYDFFGEEQIVDEEPDKGEYYISCDYGTLCIVLLQILPQVDGILRCADGEHTRQGYSRQRRDDGGSAACDDTLVKAVSLLCTGAQILCHCFPALRQQGGHLPLNQNVCSGQGSKFCRCIDNQFFLLLDQTADIVRQSASCIGDVPALCQDGHLCIGQQTFDFCRCFGTGSYAANDQYIHSSTPLSYSIFIGRSSFVHSAFSSLLYTIFRQNPRPKYHPPMIPRLLSTDFAAMLLYTALVRASTSIYKRKKDFP